MITVSGLTKSHGARTLFEDVTFRLLPGRRIALVGGNGVGKTTLLEIVLGLQGADSGTVHRPKDLRVGYLPQELLEARRGTVLDEVLSGAEHVAAIAARLEELTVAIATTTGAEHDDVLAEYGDAQSRFEQLGGYSLDSEARRILGGLGFADSDADRPFSELSGGWQMRASLARLLLARPDVLVLDEPTNHLDTDSIGWLENQLVGYEGAILFVSHDRDFIDAVAERVIEIAGGTATEYVGGFAEFVVAREEKLASIRAAATTQARQVAHAEKFIERFRYKATKARQVQSRIKTLQKLEAIKVPDLDTVKARFAFPEPRRSARVVVELDDVMVGYDDTPVLMDVNLVVERGQKLSLVGPNGAGKSTLLKAMLGELEPMEGTATLGHQVDIAYFAQHQADALDLENTVVHEFTMQVGPDALRARNPRTVLGSFGFSGDAADRRIHELSGGERTRLALAICMANPVNLLVLDEPTNHLDLPSCDLLEDALRAYPGTVLLVSHDRHLIRSVAHDLLEVRDGVVRLHHGVDDAVLSPSFEGGRAGLSSAPTKGRSRSGSDAAPPRPADKRSAARREQAEVRQSRSKATRKISAEIARIENQLADSETEVAELSRTLADPDVFGDPASAAELSERFGAAKDRSAALMEQWEAASVRLEEAQNAVG